FDATAEVLHRAVHSRQAQPRVTLFGRDEWVKDLLDQVGWHARALIAYLEPDLTATKNNRDVDRAPLGRDALDRVARVEHHVHGRLAHHGLIALNNHRLVWRRK